MKTSQIKKAIINGTVTGVKSVCGSTHIALKYAIDATEAIESASLKRLIGQSEEDTQIERWENTVRVQQQNKALAQAMMLKFKNSTRGNSKTTMKLITEVSTFNTQG